MGGGTQGDTGWVIPVFTLLAVMAGYGLWSIRVGYIIVGPGWTRVYRREQPVDFWLFTIIGGFVIPGALAVACLWEYYG